MTSRNETAATEAHRLALVIAPLLGVWLAALLLGGGELDRTIILNAYVGEAAWRLPALLVTRLGDWEVLLAIPLFAAAWLAVKQRKRAALFLLAAVIAGRLLVGFQKLTLARARPEEHEHLVRVETFSFPSGHAANSMIVYLLLALLLAQNGQQQRLALAGALLLSLLIGISRVLLGVHWPTDVVAGWAFGLFWVLVAVRLAPRFGLNRQ